VRPCMLLQRDLPVPRVRGHRYSVTSYRATIEPACERSAVFFRARILARRDLCGRAAKRAELQEVTDVVSKPGGGHGRDRPSQVPASCFVIGGRDPDHCSREPLAHRSLIWFAVWSSVVHRVTMAAQSFADPHQIGHLWGVVLALFVVAGALALLTPRTNSPRAA